MKGLVTEKMKQWMKRANRGCWKTMQVVTDQTTTITRAIIVGWQTKKWAAVIMWQSHMEEEASINGWWMQMQENGISSRKIREWLVNIMRSWWSSLGERHRQRSEVSGNRCKVCGEDVNIKCDIGSCRRCCTIGGYR